MGLAVLGAPSSTHAQMNTLTPHQATAAALKEEALSQLQSLFVQSYQPRNNPDAKPAPRKKSSVCCLSTSSIPALPPVFLQGAPSKSVDALHNNNTKHPALQHTINQQGGQQHTHRGPPPGAGGVVARKGPHHAPPVNPWHPPRTSFHLAPLNPHAPPAPNEHPAPPPAAPTRRPPCFVQAHVHAQGLGLEPAEASGEGVFLPPLVGRKASCHSRCPQSLYGGTSSGQVGVRPSYGHMPHHHSKGQLPSLAPLSSYPASKALSV